MDVNRLLWVASRFSKITIERPLRYIVDLNRLSTQCLLEYEAACATITCLIWRVKINEVVTTQ
jgi:hypothetical protein